MKVLIFLLIELIELRVIVNLFSREPAFDDAVRTQCHATENQPESAKQNRAGFQVCAHRLDARDEADGCAEIDARGTQLLSGAF